MLIDVLKEAGVIKSENVSVTPLTGGVSCEIFLVEEDGKRFVAKRALEKLKVEQDWFADTGRNIFEQRYLKYVGEKFPQWVPKIISSLEEQRVFLMEFIPEEFKDWKKRLMAGLINSDIASKIGVALGNIHASSWKDKQVAGLFQSDQNFEQLRLEPYFESIRPIYPALDTRIAAMCEKIRSSKLCLVHGDFSPKNILVSESDIKIVDCEVAWFGDPSFDIAFLLHHLIIKYWHFQKPEVLDLADRFIENYREALGETYFSELDQQHIVEVTLMMVLARLDGKSPVEYLDNEEKKSIRQKVVTLLEKPLPELANLTQGVREQ